MEERPEMDQKIVVLIKNYPPDITASGNLAKKIVDVLAKTHDVTVITHAQDEVTSNEKNIVRVKSFDRVIFEKINHGSSLERFVFRVVNRIKNRMVKSLVSQKSGMKYLKEVRTFLRQTPDAIVLPFTFDEIHDSIALKAEFPRIKLIPYVLEVFPVFIQGQEKERILNDLISSSHRIFVLPYLKDYFNGSSKVVVTEHPMVVDNTRPANPDLFDCVYVGGLDVTIRNPVFFLELLKDHPVANMATHFYSYGNCQGILAEFAKQIPSFTSHGPVSSDIAQSVLSSASLIVTIGNKNSDLVPSKLFDCISTGNPIVHFYYDEKDPYLDYLKNYPLSVCLPISSRDVAARFNDFALSHRNQKLPFTLIREKFEIFTPEYVVDVFLKELEGDTR